MSASETSARPAVIGLTTYVERAQQGVWDVPAAYLQYQYVESVTRVGGVALLLPPQPVSAAAVDAVLDGIDGLVLTGGKDVDARLYGELPHAEADEPRTERDAWELALLRGALDRGLPVLGVCRGAQVVNVALGGTLEQHLPDRVGHTAHSPSPGVYASHHVTAVEGTRLASVVGTDVLDVPTYHHQAVATHPGYVPAAWHEDGTLEAMEDPEQPFRLGVQWHPEAGDDGRLFDALVDACRNFGRLG